MYANVLSVREERLNMVDNTEQYLLVHLVLVEYFNSQDTCFECDKSLPERIVEAKKNSSLHYQRYRIFKKLLKKWFHFQN